jgi:hypothetical protein
MIKHNKHIILIITLMVASISLSSCRKTLCYDHYRSLNVLLDWDQVWERSIDFDLSTHWEIADIGYHELIPDPADDFTVITYNIEDHNDISVVYSNHNTADVAISDAVCSFLLFNHDLNHIEFNDIADRRSANVTCQKATRSTYAGDPSEITVAEPDMLYGAYISELDAIDIHEHKRMPVLMTPITFTYHILFLFKYGENNISQARGALSGMAYRAYLRSGDTSDEEATILFDNVKKYPGGYRAEVRTFGVPNYIDEQFNGPTPIHAPNKNNDKTNGQSRQILNFEVKLTGGSIKNFFIDVTDQLVRQPTGGVITVTDLCIDDDENKSIGDSGLDVDLGDWENTIDIQIPFNPTNRIYTN